MGFKLNHNANGNGTHLQGYVKTTHAKLVAAFGPGEDYGDKTTQEWHFEGPNGQVFSLYDWKTSSTPKGNYEWHIGGHDGQDLEGFKAWLLQAVG